MKDCFEHVNRIEFEITMACTGRCKHCSEGDHENCTGHIDGSVGAEVVRRLCAAHLIQSLMTFGGEPLLYPEDVFKIQKAAKEAGIPERHVITNGYFSKDEMRIREVAEGLSASGVTKIMLSVDAFHAETIPLEPVKTFAAAVLKTGVFIQTHPAWLVGKEDENPYNCKTKALLAEFAEMGIGESSGNVIFPSGNARIYLSEYFDAEYVYINPYEEDPNDIRTISISADGGVLFGNIYEKDMDEIMFAYRMRGK